MLNSFLNMPYLPDDEFYRVEAKRDFIAVKHNDLIQQQKFKLHKNKGEGLTILEQKALLYIISRIKPDDTELNEQEFDIKEFCSICGISASNSGGTYKMLKDVIVKLKSRVMWLYTDESETTVSWIDKATIYRNKGKIKIKLDNDLKPYLLMLHRNYTKIPLFSIIRMKSKYGIQLYELLQSYIYQSGVKTFTVDFLKEYLDCTNYESFSNFKNRVLIPAINDINTYSNLIVEVKYIKNGRHYDKITFYMKDLLQSKSIEDREEYIRRSANVQREFPENQLVIEGFEGI